MTSHKTIAHLLLLSSLTLSSVGTIHAQMPRTMPMRSYTPPPAPRQVYRPEPEPERQRPVPESRPEPRPERQTQYISQESRQRTDVQPESRPDPGTRHPNVTVVRPQQVTPAVRRAMTYNTRPDGVHIRPEFFAAHYGYSHPFHFIGWYAGCLNCGFVQFNSEWYFSFNGGTFGLMGQIPGNWALATDNLYVDIGDDGTYYLYDAQYPDFALQLTFVQSVGDDQAGDDGEQSGQ